MRRSVAVLAAAALIGLTGCAGATSSPAQSHLTIFAAASLSAVLPAVEEGFGVIHPAVNYTVSTGSSAAVATQIEEGAPADLLLSADVANAQRLVDDGLAADAAVTFATNHLVVVVPADNPAGIASPADLARPGVKIVAAGERVPVTRYADELVARLAGTAGYPADFAAAYQANVVSREESVSGVATKVALGEADAGIVYATDAAASTHLRTVGLPATANVLARYAGVTLARSANPDLAAELLHWLVTDQGRSVLARFGFGPPA